MARTNKAEVEGIVRKVLKKQQSDFGETVLSANEGTDGGETDIEPAVRKVLSEVLSEVSDELSSPDGEPPANGGGSRAATRKAAAGAPGKPGGGADVPPEVSTAVQAVLRDVSAEQAQTLASMFEAIGSQSDEDDDEEEAGAESYADIELGSMQQAKARGASLARGGRIGTIIKLLRKSAKLYRAAVGAAKKGRRSFNGWVNGLSSFNPVKWAIKALPDVVLYELINWLASQKENAMPGTRAAEVEPEEIEEVVRRVLSEALAEPPQESAIS